MTRAAAIGTLDGERGREVLARIARRTGLALGAIDPELVLGDPALGLDSVAILELVLDCEAACGCSLPAELLQAAPLTVGGLMSALGEALRSAGR